MHLSQQIFCHFYFCAIIGYFKIPKAFENAEVCTAKKCQLIPFQPLLMHMVLLLFFVGSVLTWLICQCFRTAPGPHRHRPPAPGWSQMKQCSHLHTRDSNCYLQQRLLPMLPHSKQQPRQPLQQLLKVNRPKIHRPRRVNPKNRTVHRLERVKKSLSLLIAGPRRSGWGWRLPNWPLLLLPGLIGVSDGCGGDCGDEKTENKFLDWTF
jgi:hypothetical protein